MSNTSDKCRTFKDKRASGRELINKSDKTYSNWFEQDANDFMFLVAVFFE